MPPKAGSSFWISLYRAAALLLHPLAVVLSWGDALLSRLKRGRESFFRERLGFYPGSERSALEGARVVWVHAASAGEANAVTPLLRELRKARPAVRVVLTTSSRTGRRAAREERVADAVFLAPLDLPRPVSRAFRAFRPALLAVAETEIWPLLYERCARNRVPLLTVNGRLSDRSFPKYRRFRPLFSGPLAHVDSFLMQTRADADKVRALGAPEERIRIAGQMKYDVAPPHPSKVADLRRGLGLRGDEPLFALGSVRDGEEDSLFQALKELLRMVPAAKVLVAPRHMRNVPVYTAKLESIGLQWTLRSGIGPVRPWRVMVLDTFGELTAAYALCRGAFVGGTLVPIGGHNLVEPALCKVPVCYGPHTANVREADEALTASGGGVRMRDASDLPAVFAGWADGSASREAGEKAYAAVDSMRGATARTLQEILRFLPE
jgi:3-deoxy-D-manno-octulosonic-acid transferase